MDRPDWWRSTYDKQLHLICDLTADDATALCSLTKPRDQWEDPGDEDDSGRCFACLLRHGQELSRRQEPSRWLT